VPNLTEDGNRLVQNLANRHGLSTDAVTHMLFAVYNGNGTMAQFGHPEFGGSGQWMRGGMTMVSNLFNHQLKYRVDSLCNEISNSLSSSLFLPDPTYNWWPTEFGTPSATGSQNNVRYAYFPASRRLAVTTGGDVWVYDTLDHQIGGVLSSKEWVDQSPSPVNSALSIFRRCRSFRGAEWHNKTILRSALLLRLSRRFHSIHLQWIAAISTIWELPLDQPNRLLTIRAFWRHLSDWGLSKRRAISRKKSLP
jgi:hypothetical protein